MKLTLPENISEVTLGQYQADVELSKKEMPDFDRKCKRIEIFTGIPADQLKGIKKKDLADILSQIEDALSIGIKFQNRFTLNDIEFGLIPNFDNLEIPADPEQFCEFLDLQKYGIEIETLHKTMAVLFRPILNKDRFDNYTIVEYNGTEQYGELMKKMPLHLANGALGFFYHLARELRLHIAAYTREVQAKVNALESILKDGVGTPA